MKRRSFIKASLLATAVKAILPQFARASETAKKERTAFYELRVYLLKNGQHQKLVEDYYTNALIPALTVSYGSLDDWLRVNDKLANDSAYLEAGKFYLNAPATEPAYERIESSLLRAFAPGHKLKAPGAIPRIFELRSYENLGEDAGKKKLDMFNEAGEIDVFIRLGFEPVFFGETLIGGSCPNLTYMVTFDDMESHDRHWKAFGNDPEWKKISAIPEYGDAKRISRITSTLLTPLACSQI
jgi:hypothetical protein